MSLLLCLPFNRFRSQQHQRARPASIRPYIAPSLQPSTKLLASEDRRPRRVTATRSTPPQRRSTGTFVSTGFAHNNSKLLAGTRYVPTSTRSPDLEWISLTTTCGCRLRSHSGATTGTLACCLRRDRHEWTTSAACRPNAAPSCLPSEDRRPRAGNDNNNMRTIRRRTIDPAPSCLPAKIRVGHDHWCDGMRTTTSICLPAKIGVANDEDEADKD